MITVSQTNTPPSSPEVASEASVSSQQQPVIDAAGLSHRELNERVRSAVGKGSGAVRLMNVRGQRYLGAGLRGQVRLEVEGVPGNDLAAFMDGPTIIVHGDAQDGVANTMNQGKVVIHGYAGDVLGYGMRGGKLFVRGSVGYRVGIHMKEYKRQVPVVIAGGAAGDFFGEYMAGGLLILLGLDLKERTPLVGDYCGTGMHGGTIFLRGKPQNSRIAHEQVELVEATEDDLQLLQPHLAEYCVDFALDLENILSEPFWKLKPVSHRPYGSKYAV